MPTALISAMPPAAATPDSMAVGSGQKVGAIVYWPMMPRISTTIIQTGCSGPMKTQAINPAADSRQAEATYIVRAPDRSERRLQ